MVETGEFQFAAGAVEAEVGLFDDLEESAFKGGLLLGGLAVEELLALGFLGLVVDLYFPGLWRLYITREVDNKFVYRGSNKNACFLSGFCKNNFSLRLSLIHI